MKCRCRSYDETYPANISYSHRTNYSSAFAEDLLSPLSTQAVLPSSVSDDIDILTIYTLHAYCARVLQCRGRDSSVDREPDS